jgi:protein-disulfide isomerase
MFKAVPVQTWHCLTKLMKRLLPFLIILLVLVAAVGGGWYLKNRNTTSSGPMAVHAPGPAPAPVSSGGASDPAPVAAVKEPGAEPPHALGPVDAPVTLEEFGDFECPPCGMLHPELLKIESKYGSRLRIVFREFPLVPAHQHALAAARAAEAAGMQGKFWEMHHMLFETQRAWHDTFDVRPIFEQYALRIGLDVEKFRTDISSQTVERRIFLDGKRGHALGVSGTPTVFLNGREVPFEALSAAKLSALIDAELARAPR